VLTAGKSRRFENFQRKEQGVFVTKTTGGVSTMAAKIRPLQDRVIVKRVKEEEKTKGGIIIPDTAKEKPIEGEVIAVGNGKVQDDGKIRPLDVKIGDRVLFGKYSGTEVKLDGEEALILREDDIVGVIEK
jgi:chaperonin GroES